MGFLKKLSAALGLSILFVGFYSKFKFWMKNGKTLDFFGFSKFLKFWIVRIVTAGWWTDKTRLDRFCRFSKNWVVFIDISIHVYNSNPVEWFFQVEETVSTMDVSKLYLLVNTPCVLFLLDLLFFFVRINIDTVSTKSLLLIFCIYPLETAQYIGLYIN
jgi:hypothetical protein